MSYIISVLAIILATTAVAQPAPMPSVVYPSPLSADGVFTLDATRTVPVVNVITRAIEPQALVILGLADTSAEPITLFIHSQGGSVASGQVILDAIAAVQARDITVRCVVAGGALSMAMHILAACDERYGYSDSLLLWHPIGAYAQPAHHTFEEWVTVYAEILEREYTLDAALRDTLGISEALFQLALRRETHWRCRDLAKVAPGFINCGVTSVTVTGE